MLSGALLIRQSFHSSEALIDQKTQRVVRLRNKVGDGKKVVLSSIEQHRHIIKIQHYMQPSKRITESLIYSYRLHLMLANSSPQKLTKLHISLGRIRPSVSACEEK